MRTVFDINRQLYLPESEAITDNFRLYEVADKLEPVSFIDMTFMVEMVEPLRQAVNRPFFVNSGCRTKATNTRVGGHPRSLHLMFNPDHKYVNGCLALDIKCDHWDNQTKGVFVKNAKQLGLSIGFGSTFFHIDARVLISMPRAEFNY